MNSSVKTEFNFRDYLSRNPQSITIAGLGILIVLLIFLSPHTAEGENIFLSERNIKTLFESSAAYSIGAFAMSIVLMSGLIDLSVSSVIAISGIVLGTLLRVGIPLPICIIIVLLVGILVGVINSILVVEIGIQPFLATLAVAMVVGNVAYMISQGKQIVLNNTDFTSIFGFNIFLGVPVLAWWTLLFLIIAFVVIRKTKYGRALQAVGGNEVAAFNSGISIRKVKYLAFSYMGMVSAFVGLTVVARLRIAQPSAGAGYFFDFIVAAILGGTSFTGGMGGSVIAVLCGSLLVAVFSNALNLLGVDTYVQQTLKGVLILVSIILAVVVTKQRGK